MAEALFLPTLSDVDVVGIAYRDPDRAPVCGPLAQHAVEPWIRLVQEDRSVHEHIDPRAGPAEEVDERGYRQVGPLLVQGDEFGAHCPCRACLPELRPKGVHVLAQRLGGHDCP